MTGKTKRGNEYTIRHDKKTNGYSKVIADQEAKPLIEQYFKDEPERLKKVINKKITNDMIRLAVRGTFDTLSQRLFLTKRISVEHPTNKGYYKEIKVLGRFGKRRLEVLRKNKIKLDKT